LPLSGERDFSRRELLAALGWFSRRRLITVAGIRFELLRRGAPERHYLLIHGDEETARQVLLARMQRHRPGIAFLVTHQQRLVRWGALRFDPNRILSGAGAERNLRALNPQLPEADLKLAMEWLERERGRLIRTLLPKRGRLLVALHNNQPGYSVHHEIPISDETALNDPQHSHDFYLATHPEDFRRLVRSPFNAVLQVRKPVDDDGSLSRLAARVGARYVNIEALLGSLAKQTRMLEWLADDLGWRDPQDEAVPAS